MNLAVMAAVFPVIFLGELPDKTMVASLLLSARGRPGAVWLGAAGAFAIHVVIAVSLGAATVHLLHGPIVGYTVAAVFALGAVLAAREAIRAHHSRPHDSAAAEGDVGQRARLTPHRGSAARTTLAAFSVVFAAEWGDLTQILTADMALRYHAPLSVGTAALAALWSVAALAVIGGSRLGHLLNPVALRAITAIVLGGLAVYTAVSTFI